MLLAAYIPLGAYSCSHAIHRLLLAASYWPPTFRLLLAADDSPHRIGAYCSPPMTGRLWLAAYGWPTTSGRRRRLLATAVQVGACGLLAASFWPPTSGGLLLAAYDWPCPLARLLAAFC